MAMLFTCQVMVWIPYPQRDKLNAGIGAIYGAALGYKQNALL